MLMLGKRPALVSPRALKGVALMRQTLDALGPAPAVTTNWSLAVDTNTGGDWGMLANDRYGDCVEAAEAHGDMARTANAGTMVRPTDKDVTDLYAAVTGFNIVGDAHDFGTNESDMCAFMGTTGFLGHKSDGNARIDYTNVDHVKWSLQIFGGMLIGVQLPQYAMTQFNAGKAWEIDIFQDPTAIGGHGVWVDHGDADYAYVVTWAKLQPVSWKFFARYCDEAHIEAFPDWIMQGGTAPNALNLQQLMGYLASLGSGT